MSRRRATIKSPPFPLDVGNRDEQLELALASLFDTLGRKILDEFSFPVTIELTFERRDWDGWVAAHLGGNLLPKRGRGYGDDD